MAKRTLGKSRKIKSLDRYLGDVGVYDLSKPLKVGDAKLDFLVIGKIKQVSGGPVVTVWPSEDEHGAFASTTPLKIVKSDEIADALLELGYELV